MSFTLEFDLTGAILVLKTLTFIEKLLTYKFTVSKVAGRCVTVFLAMTLGHLAIAKSFARRHGYAIDESQELVFLGLPTFSNGFFPTMPTGDAF
jgi:MFS superfamily sulfate permease-like transporter